MSDIHETAPDAIVTDEAGLLLGPAQIADFLGWGVAGSRRADRLIRLGAIPVFRVGGRAAATREGLRAWLAGNTERAQAEHQARASAADRPDA